MLRVKSLQCNNRAISSRHTKLFYPTRTIGAAKTSIHVGTKNVAGKKKKTKCSEPGSGDKAGRRPGCGHAPSRWMTSDERAYVIAPT